MSSAGRAVAPSTAALSAAALSGARSPSGAPASAAQSLRTLILSLGLPLDSLSSFLISSFKYFSLPMDPARLAKIRKQLDRPAPAGRALAAAAADSKGVVLDDETLSAYASAIDPAAGDSGGDGRGFSGQEPGGQESGGKESAGQESGTRKTLSASGDIPALAGEIKALSGEIDTRWTLLNRLPGRNGAFWMVFPLRCSADGLDFDITLRLLLENQGSLPLKAARLAVDIRTAKSRRLFVLDKPGEGGGLRLYLDPLPSKTEQKRLEKELGGILAAGSVRIFEAGPSAFDGEAGLPLGVDEEV
ncbi:MAG: hypothetical protein LBI85_01050 [Spirochaetaceae bacterium]|jgi:hypothetical protein|nr:hypothetical protein [Spirochaetaceae bacterium]